MSHSCPSLISNGLLYMVMYNGLHVTDVLFTCNWTGVLHVLDWRQWHRQLLPPCGSGEDGCHVCYDHLSLCMEATRNMFGSSTAQATMVQK